MNQKFFVGISGAAAIGVLLMTSLSEDKSLIVDKPIVFPSYNQNYSPADLSKAFALSQDYPSKYDEKTEYPWQKIDFKSKEGSMMYLLTVLNYCLEGNVEVGFKSQNNSVRRWYHAPWMHDDQDYDDATKLYVGAGREYIHGLTKERSTPTYEIHEKQNKLLQTWAVGLYNEPGGHTFYKVWKSDNSGRPIIANTNFPEGTVSFKLLFTSATPELVPFLANSLEWDANIYPEEPLKYKEGKETIDDAKKRQQRVTQKVRLMQIDVAIKDKRAGASGWVMGTFIYDASRSGKTVWDRMNPVGLSWGDDSQVLTNMNVDGAFVNKELKETILNEDLVRNNKPQENFPANKAYMKYHGLGGRLNGPADNPISSCISCHGQAAITTKGEPLSLGEFGASRASFNKTSFDKYFSTPKAGAYERTVDGVTYLTNDYSLQLTIAIRNYINAQNHKQHLMKTGANSGKLWSEEVKDLPIISR